MTAITVGRRYYSNLQEDYFRVLFIGDNFSFCKFESGCECILNNSSFHNGDIVKVPETLKVTVYLNQNGTLDFCNPFGTAIASRVVEFEIDKFEKEDEK